MIRLYQWIIYFSRCVSDKCGFGQKSKILTDYRSYWWCNTSSNCTARQWIKTSAKRTSTRTRTFFDNEIYNFQKKKNGKKEVLKCGWIAHEHLITWQKFISTKHKINNWFSSKVKRRHSSIFGRTVRRSMGGRHWVEYSTVRNSRTKVFALKALSGTLLDTNKWKTILSESAATHTRTRKHAALGKRHCLRFWLFHQKNDSVPSAHYVSGVPLVRVPALCSTFGCTKSKCFGSRSCDEHTNELLFVQFELG